jgi:hypothetical protein
MTSTTVKRSSFKTFLNTGTSGSPTWSILGDGITSAKINYNPKTLETLYIDQSTGTTEIESYRPTLPIEAIAKFGDPAFNFVDNIRIARGVLGSAYAEVVNVWLYQTPSGGAYPAERQQVSIQIEDFGGDGGTAARINYTINFMGAPVVGTFNPTTLTFTANP